jgi:ketosteroid isomerase-like protein
MRHTLLSVAFLALMVPTMGRADDADAEKQVAMVSQQWREAIIKGDTKAKDAILSDDSVSIDPYGKFVSKQDTKNDKDNSFVFEAMDASEVKVRVYGDAAVVTNRIHVKWKNKDEKGDNHVRVSEFYAKQGGKWRLVSSQVTFIAEPPK